VCISSDMEREKGLMIIEEDLGKTIFINGGS
jgi:hypothetical protein